MRDEISRAAARRATLVAVPAAVLAGLFALWLLSGVWRDQPDASASGAGRPMATGPVQMAAPALTGRAAVVCRALVARLPNDLGDLPRRPVTAGPEQNAAYGDPPVTLGCAAGSPVSLAPEATVWVLSGVCWYAEERADSTVWITVDREVPITVTVPRAYQGPSQQVIVFSDPILATVPAAATMPTGCR